MRYPLRMIPFLIGSVLAVSATSTFAEDDFQFRVESNLRAGVAKVVITPPADTPVVGHVRPTNGVRDPIRAGVLLLANQQCLMLNKYQVFRKPFEHLYRLHPFRLLNPVLQEYRRCCYQTYHRFSLQSFFKICHQETSPNSRPSRGDAPSPWVGEGFAP